MVFASIFLFQGLGAFDDGVADINFWGVCYRHSGSFIGFFIDKLALYCAFTDAKPFYKKLGAHKTIKSRVNWFKTVKLHNTFKRLAISL